MAQATDLILVDGSSFLYRAYFAAKSGLTTKSGFPTGATYIITRMMRNLLHDYPTNKILVTFDAHGKSFRNDMYPEYKSNRPPMPEDLAIQVPTIHHIIAAMGLPIIAMPGVEADDVLGSYAVAAQARGLNSIICTGDKDLAQLVNEHIHLKDTMKDITYTRKEVINKYGVPPELIIDYLALKGDTSDNIPGMSGVGDVTALILLQNIGGIFTLKDNLDKVKQLNIRGKNTFGKRFEEQWPMIELSYRLATIKTDLELPIPIDEIRQPVENNQVLIALFEHLEFHRFAGEQRAKKAIEDETRQEYNTPEQQPYLPQIIGLNLNPEIFAAAQGNANVNPQSLTANTATPITQVTPDTTSQAYSAPNVPNATPTESATLTNAATLAETKTTATTSETTESSNTLASETLSPSSATPEGLESLVPLPPENPKISVSSHKFKKATPAFADTTSQNTATEPTKIVNLAASSGTITATDDEEATQQDFVEPIVANSLLSQIEEATAPEIMEQIRSSHQHLSSKSKLQSHNKSTKTKKVHQESAIMQQLDLMNSQNDAGSLETNENAQVANTSTAKTPVSAAIPANNTNTANTSTAATPATNTNSAATQFTDPANTPAQVAPAVATGNANSEISASAQIEQKAEKSLLAALQGRVPNEDIKRFEGGFKLVLTQEQLDELLGKLKNCSEFAFSTASTEAQPSMCVLVGLSFTLSEAESYYIPLRHEYENAPEQLDPQSTLDKLQEVFADPKIIKIAHDLKLHRLKLKFAGVDLAFPMLDTMLLTHLINPTQTIVLDDLANRYNNYNSLRYNENFDYSCPSNTQNVNQALRKECECSLMSFRLKQKAMPDLQESYKEKADFLLDIEMQVLDSLFEMEYVGTLVDPQSMAKLTVDFNDQLAKLQKSIFDLSGEPFKITSPRALGTILFEKMKIPYPRTTTKIDTSGHRSYSTSEEILSELGKYPIAERVLQYRGLAKLISTYTSKLPELISERTGRIHTNFNLAGTITGRLSSSDPNLQNIPIRTNNGKQIRQAFVSKEGYSIVSADYSQIELRIIAHLSKDPNLQKAFFSGQDVHKVTASEVLNKPISQITPEERGHAKSTNYGLMYGMSYMGLSKLTGISKTQAKDYINQYFIKYPNIKDFMESIRNFATEHGYITSLDGRKIYISNIKSQGVPYRQACRAAINAPMQSGAADIIKHAMIDVNKYIKTLEPGLVNFILQVHDELVFEVKDSFVAEFQDKLKVIMTNAYTLDVPLVVDVGCGKSWGTAH